MAQTVFAQTGKTKVLILPFKSIEKNDSYNYIEPTLTEAIRKTLREKFVYKEFDEEKIGDIVLENKIFPEDLHNKSVAMTLGAYARQDVTIAGGFRVQEGTDGSTITTEVYILNTAAKKLIRGFRVKGPASARLFDTVEEIAQTIAKEAEKILPGRNDKGRKNFLDDEPFLVNWSIGLRSGAGFYSGGYGNILEMRPPVFTFLIQTAISPISKNFYLQAEGAYFVHRVKQGANPPIVQGGFQLTSSNLHSGLSMMYLMPIGSFSLGPKIGGGYLWQQNEVSGATRTTTPNYFPFGTAGLEVWWRLTKFISLSAAFQTHLYLEDGVQTLGSFGTLGASIHL